MTLAWRLRFWLGRNIGKVVVYFALIVLTLTAIFSVVGVLQGSRERAQLCAYVDNEHNRDRQQIIDRLRLTYAAFPELVRRRGQARLAFDQAKHDYYSIRSTRPPYCSRVRKNPVKPFPTFAQFQPG